MPVSVLDSAVADLARFRNAHGPAEHTSAVLRPGEYRSKFDRWERRASVRSRPQRIVTGDDSIYFPPELFPPANHQLVVDRGEDLVRRLLVHRFYAYMDFTIELEQFAVIPVCTHISRNRVGIFMPARMREDAFKINTDESWHAQFSFDVVRQVELRTAIPATLPDLPQFVVRINEVRRRIDSDLHGIDRLIFAIVSETLISALLSELPKDQRLPAGVRDLVGDHAEDERRHHAFFTDLLYHVWPTLSRDQRSRIGPWIPELITAFLEPDYLATTYALHEVGLTPREIDQVMTESYPADAVSRSISVGARATIKHFSRVGALSDGPTMEAFDRAGLLLSAY